MDFEFSAEQVAIRDTIRELVQDRVSPRAAEIDRTGEYPKDIERLFADNGILGIPFPEEYGGISGSSVTICTGIEESPPSSSSAKPARGRSRSSSTSSASEVRPPHRSSSRTSRCPQPTGSVKRARASRSRSLCWTDRGRASARRRSASLKALSI